MEAWLKIIAGMCLLAFGLAYLYRPVWVLTLNVMFRTLVFNDGHVLLYRRRLGLLLFLASILFFYSGFNNLAHDMSVKQPSAYLDIGDAYRNFRGQNYADTIARCHEILKRDPHNIHAWILLGSAWAAMGNEDKAKQAWGHVPSAIHHSPDTGKIIGSHQ